jgi:hypothetical protein
MILDSQSLGRVTFEILANYYAIQGDPNKTNLIISYALDALPKKITLKLLYSLVRLCEKKKGIFRINSRIPRCSNFKIQYISLAFLQF